MHGDETPLRCFFALPLAPEARDELARVVRSLQGSEWAERVRWVPAANLHLTLLFLGALEPGRARAVADAVGAATSALPPFPYELSGLDALPSKRRARVVVAGIAEQPALQALAAGVSQSLVPLGFEPDARPFRPHVTLGRARRGPLRSPPLDVPVAPLRTQARHVVLYRSDSGPGGSRYTPLARLPLAGG